MRIVLAHNNFRITGGADIFYRDVGRVLESKGHEVAYFSAKDDSNPETEWERYFPQAVEYNSGSLIKRFASFPAMLYSRAAKRNFKELLQDFQPDLVHAFAIYVKLTPSILDAAAKLRIPVVMTCNDYKLICPNYTLYHHGRICEECKGRHFYRAAVNKCNRDSMVFSMAVAFEAYLHEALNIYRKNVDTFLFESEFIARKTEEFWGDRTFRWRLMRKPFDSRSYPLSKQYQDYILYVGRLHESKGVHILLDAMKQAPGTHLKIVGDGPFAPVLQRQANELGLNNVEFCGWKTGPEVSNYIASSRFVIVPSVWYENFPYVITQAFALGKACIGSEMGGIPELIRNGEFGYLYPPLDAFALAGHIRSLWGDPNRAVEMGSAAKSWADTQFNDDAVHQVLLDIYQDTLQRGSSR